MMKSLLYSAGFLVLVSCGNSVKTTTEATPPSASARETLETKTTAPDADVPAVSEAVEPPPAAETESKPVQKGSQSSGEKPGKPVLQGSWELEKVYGAKEPFKMLFPEQVPNISFDLRTYIVSGNNGCNGYNGPFTLKNGKLTIKDPASTLKLCHGVNDQLFMTTLQMTNGYKFEGDKLVLTLDGEGLMLFKPKK